MGLLRVLLAYAVVFQHIGQPFGKNFLDAGFSVMLFFILSGFYISLVLHKKYKCLPVWKFYCSRYFRLMPLFLVGNIIVFVAYMRIGQHPFVDKWHSLNFMQRIVITVPNLTLIGNDLLTHIMFIGDKITLSSQIKAEDSAYIYLLNRPTWSLSVELLFYLIAPFIVYSIWRTLIFFSIGVFWYVWIQWGDPMFLFNNPKMFTYTPSYIPFFAIGIFSFYIYDNKNKMRDSIFFYPVVATVCLVMLLIDLRPESYPYVIFPFGIVVLFELTKNNKVDKWFAELSYPLYILHSPILFLMGGTDSSLILIVVSLASISTIYLLERPFEKLRRRFIGTTKPIIFNNLK